MSNRRSWYSAIAPGILLAATGVGAGDLLSAGLAGSQVGLPLLWAALAGAGLKWILSEGLARWQLATGTTLLEGWAWRLGHWIRWVFLVYLLLFTMVVGGALMTACGIAGAGLLPLGSPETSKIVWGLIHSAAGLALVRYGSFALFEGLMSVLIGIMFVTVLATAVMIAPDWGSVALGLIPTIPEGSTGWLLAVLGGVGGTVTLLSYGYWIRERGRHGLADVSLCRLDLAVGNGLTALFGLAVIIIGSRIKLEGGGAAVALQMADQLTLAIGPAGKWIFLAGFWGAVFSSLLGVWQSIPYMFADFLDLQRACPDAATGGLRTTLLRATKAYRGYLLFIATVPALFLWTTVTQIQLAYGIIGALFLPLVALTLLILNNREEWVGRPFLSGYAINAVLVAALLFFGYLGLGEIWGMVGSLAG
jgi:Mn2+/Fe2+ NRAMP family transporter